MTGAASAAPGRIEWGVVVAYAPIAYLLLAAWVVVAALAAYGVWVFLEASNETRRSFEQAAVIIPVRGIPPQLDELWACLLRQTYRPWRLLFVVESADDPAHAALCRILRDGDADPPAEIVIAGLATSTGQKVWNLLAGLKALRETDKIVVFADADTAPTPDWLQGAIEALPESGIALVSGYRWLMPCNNSWATRFICTINSSVATLPRVDGLNLAWGGTMALRRETLERIGIEQVWQGSSLDDLPLTRAIRDHGGEIICPSAIMVPSPASYDWRHGIAFARRQYLFLRLYEPFHWVIAAGATTVPLLGWACALPLALGGDRIAIAAIIVANLLDQCRAALRRRVVMRRWGEAGLRRLAPVLWLDRWATPAWLAFHAAIVWSTLLGQTIRWGGRVYLIHGRQSVSVSPDPA
jgi:hypothetical protein